VKVKENSDKKTEESFRNL